MEDTDVKLPFIKVVTAWLTVVLSSTWQTFSIIPWDKLAQFAAFIYSCALILEWLKKQIIKWREADGTD